MEVFDPSVHNICINEQRQPVRHQDNPELLAFLNQMSDSVVFLPETEVVRNQYPEIFPKLEEEVYFINEPSEEQVAIDAESQETTFDSADGTVVSPNNCNNVAKWHDDDAVKHLIHLRRKELLPLFESTALSSMRKWQKLALVLASKQPNNKYWSFTWKQCESKWKDLIKNYNKAKDNMGARSSGESPVRFRIFEDMDEGGKNSPSVKPVSTASNMDSPMSSNSASSASASSSKNIGSSDEPPKKKTKLEKKFEELHEAVHTKEEEKEAARERRHREILKVQLESIEAYKDMMGRLIEKL